MPRKGPHAAKLAGARDHKKKKNSKLTAPEKVLLKKKRQGSQAGPYGGANRLAEKPNKSLLAAKGKRAVFIPVRPQEYTYDEIKGAKPLRWPLPTVPRGAPKKVKEIRYFSPSGLALPSFFDLIRLVFFEFSIEYDIFLNIL